MRKYWKDQSHTITAYIKSYFTSVACRSFLYLEPIDERCFISLNDCGTYTAHDWLDMFFTQKQMISNTEVNIPYT